MTVDLNQSLVSITAPTFPLILKCGDARSKITKSATGYRAVRYFVTQTVIFIDGIREFQDFPADEIKAEVAFVETRCDE